MSRQEAFEQYSYALKLGQKYYKSAVISGRYPYLQALDEVLDESMVVGRAEIGLVNIPSDRRRKKRREAQRPGRKFHAAAGYRFGICHQMDHPL